MLRPKDSNTQEDSKPSKGDEVPLSRTTSETSTSSRKPSDVVTYKLRETKKPADDETPESVNVKPEKSQPDEYAIASLIKQVQDL